MRKLIAGMKISLDGKTEGSQGMADWVEAWSDDYGLMPQIDACLLGAGMYPGKLPAPAEVEWARFAAETPHYVLSSTLASALWPQTSFVRGLEDIAALKRQPGKDIYLVGGGRTTASLIDAGLVDELRLIAYPLVAGEGKALFATTERRRELELKKVRELPDGLVSLTYAIG